MNYLAAEVEMRVRGGSRWSSDYIPKIDFFDLPEIHFLDQVEAESRREDEYRIDVVKRLIEAQQNSKKLI